MKEKQEALSLIDKVIKTEKAIISKTKKDDEITSV